MPRYASNLEDFVAQRSPAFWVHGHVHNACDYQLGDCNVVCNPKGYPDEDTPGYDPIKCIYI